MPQKAMEITSSAHAMAIALYLMSSLMGVLAILGADIAPSLQTSLGPVGFGTWAFALVLSGLVCAVVCVVPHHGSATSISRALIIELWAALALAILVTMYTSVLVIYGKGPTVLMFTATIILGCLGRVGQIGLDLRRIKRARVEAQTVQVAADPEGR